MGKDFETPAKQKTREEDVHDRFWTFRDRKHYHSVWRIIFPYKRGDRMIKFVPWNLFVEAMLAHPVNCTLKKADGVEIFTCYAPHQFDKIPRSDLYRYRKDLGNTFEMAANRMSLEGEAVSR